MQKRAALIVDVNELKTRILSIFEQFKNTDGKYLKLFLNEARCKTEPNKPEVQCNDVNEYLSSKSVVYKGIQLENDEEKLPNAVEYRISLMNFLLEEFRKYFPDGNTESFNVFNPKKMPAADDYAKARTYGIIEIKVLNDFFKISIEEDEIIEQWQTMLLSAVQHASYCEIKNSKTTVSAFWSQLLKWPEIEWGADIKRLVYIVLSLPVSSAEAERGFSTLKYMRDSHRSRLTPANLDAMLRIKLNGPDELDYFAAAKYARKWINGGHFATDSKVRAKDPETVSHSLLEEENVESKKAYLYKSTIF